MQTTGNGRLLHEEDLYLSDRSALEKRIKRHIIGRVRDYFAATAPGLETLCLAELLSLPLTVQSAQACPGGVAFQGRLVDCYMANLHLRTANRILMRVDSFKATRFTELERKLSQLPWELFLEPGQEFEFRIRAKKSRLYHSEAIADRFRSSISSRIPSPHREHPARDNRHPPLKIFVRNVRDRFTVSLDSSGDSLYKRGVKTQAARAPLRETTAAAILIQSAYTPPEPLIDPMCGSGTFSTEAAMQVSHIPAGWYRKFAFTSWPAHRQAMRRWDHLKAEAEKRIAIPKRPVVLATDIDRRACSAYKKAIRGHRFGAAIQISPGDFFNCRPQHFTRRCGLVVINPPYGRRIHTSEGPRVLLGRIANKLIRDFPGWKFALVIPAKSMIAQLSLPVRVFPIFHGGLHVYTAIGKVPPAAHSRLP